MDRKIFFALAAIAGVCAAILLLPSHEPEEPGATASHGQTPPASSGPRLKHSGARKREASPDGPSDEALPYAKAEARAATAERRATPYFQHVKAVGKRWTVLANTLGPEGHEELAADMRTLSRELRKASLPDGTEETQTAALEHEARLLTTLREMDLDGEPAEVRVFLEEAFQAVTAGEAPPKTEPVAAAGGEPPTPEDGTPAQVEPQPEASAGP